MSRPKKTDTSAPPGPRLVSATRRARAVQTAAPTHEAIAVRAYEFFLEEGRVHGRDLGHWLRAEQELLNVEMPVGPARKVAGARAKA
jgi:hypothetical protein